jgi:hypothetical protein
MNRTAPDPANLKAPRSAVTASCKPAKNTASRFLDLAASSDAPRLWHTIIDASPDAGVWSTYSNYRFRLSHLQARGALVADRSFVLFHDGQPCGLAPVVLARDDEMVVATYGGISLTWPLIVPGIGDPLEIERSLGDGVERRARDGGPGQLSLMFTPSDGGAGCADRFHRIVRERHFIDTSYMAHCVDVSHDTLSTVRDRYRRYVRKFRDEYDLRVIGADDVNDSLAATYMDLHVKDAGTVSRPLITYERQVDQVRAGEAFFVCAHKLSENRIAGMLLIQVFKSAAFDASVAVDPRFEDEGVSYLLKWRAIERLFEIGVRHYELGRAALSPSFLWLPSAKNYGITFFKNGWTRGRLRPVWCAERFYSAQALDRFLARKRDELVRHFSL